LQAFISQSFYYLPDSFEVWRNFRSLSGVFMRIDFVIVAIALVSSACTGRVVNEEHPAAGGWETDFFDDFDRFNTENWQDQILWVNNEQQCLCAR
jgi:hypothetical protein